MFYVRKTCCIPRSKRYRRPTVDRSSVYVSGAALCTALVIKPIFLVLVSTPALASFDCFGWVVCEERLENGLGEVLVAGLEVLLVAALVVGLVMDFVVYFVVDSFVDLAVDFGLDMA